MARINEVRNEFEKHGWKLVSDKYQNQTIGLTCICNEGHTVIVTLKDFKKKPICMHCEEKKNDPIANINAIPKNQNVKRTLAFDQSSEISGWSVFDNNELIGYGNYKISKDKTLAERLHIIYIWSKNMIASWEPDYIAIEDIQLQTFKRADGKDGNAVVTYKALAKVQGLLEMLSFVSLKNSSSYSIIPSSTWKSYCGITQRTRTEQKKAAQVKINEWYGKNVTEDEADAICIGKYMAEKHIKNNSIIVFGG